jgi:PAS domain S-box-containing protein
MRTLDAAAVFEQVEGDLFENLPVMFAVTRPAQSGDAEPILEDCNRRFANRLGYDKASLRGRAVGSLYTPESAAQFYDGGYERARAGEFERTQCDLVAADGSIVHTLVRAAPRQSDGATVGLVSLYVDITARRRREEHLQVLNRVMRHNMRNDLNVLYGHVQMLTGTGDDAVERSARIVGKTVERWIQLTDKAKQIEQLFEDTQTRERSIRAVTNETQTTVELSYPSATVETDVAVAPDVRVSSRLQAALEELCENGVKHNEGEDPTVTVRARWASPDGWLRIDVADRGPGVPAHERTILRDGEETPLVHGSGLGLWLVRAVVRHAGGRLSVSDRDGGGSVVTVVVPIDQSPTHR